MDSENVWKLLKLSVLPEQENFVASNTESIVEAYTTLVSGGSALPFGLYRDDVPVGFVMFGYGTTGDNDEPAVADGNYCLWRLMIGKNYQGQGLGRQAMQACLAWLEEKPCGPADYCWLSYEPENTKAKALYAAYGFVENGEICGEEVVAVRPL